MSGREHTVPLPEWGSAEHRLALDRRQQLLDDFFERGDGIEGPALAAVRALLDDIEERRKPIYVL
jgi:hypothetical protein